MWNTIEVPMKSKAEFIRHCLSGLRVLDLGGYGYRSDNPYERQLSQTWSCVKQRTVADRSESADIVCDLNAFPLPTLDSQWDVTTAFDVLEHLDSPVQVLRWIPTDRMLVSLPNCLSPCARRMEQKGFDHLYSFTWYTATVLLRHGGWVVDSWTYTMGKWSFITCVANMLGSLWPSLAATGMMFDCYREQKSESRS